MGPIPTTIEDFWRMIWEEKICVIVMLTRIMEDGKKKCEQYWPSELQVPIEFGDFSITLSDEEVTKEITNRHLHIVKKSNNEKKDLWQLHYTEWPDQGIPQVSTSFLKLIHLSNEHNTSNSPIIVHCSAGLGRTGTFCIVHEVLEMVSKDKKFKNVSIGKLIIETRESRFGMVQTVEQLEFIYKSLSEGLNQNISNIDLKKSAKELQKQNSSNPDRHYQKFSAVFDNK